MYLESFDLPSAKAEDGFILSYPKELEMRCYTVNDAYPFKIFPRRGLSEIRFDPITILYGTNGSGKSTLLGVMARRLGLECSSTLPDAGCMDAYVNLCRAHISPRIREIPKESKMLRSDDVFDLLLDQRSINMSIRDEREALFREYKKIHDTPYSESPFMSFDQLDELKRRNEAYRVSKGEFTARRLPREVRAGSNGESAFRYFTERIGENALYLLDEPENSLSPRLVLELAEFLESSVRFFGCQLVIATHSPFLLAMKGARIYDLDSTPVTVKDWRELDNVKVYFDFFKKHMSREGKD